MCERTCPECGSTEHYEGYGLIGSYIVCAGCCTVLANRRDIDAAPIDMTEDQAGQWRRDGTFVLAGAEAKDPTDDDMFKDTTNG
jgi:transcription initiation factor TFIIIB Brf1 subunit/transcription initiation factor TFIIB